MWKAFRGVKRYLESLAYAGLEPDQPLALRRPGRLRRLKKRLEPLLFRGLRPETALLPPPMSRKRKIEWALAAIAGCALIAGLVVVLTSARRPPREAPPVKEDTVADLLPKDLESGKPPSVVVEQIGLQTKGNQQLIVGTVRNIGTTSRSVRVSLDLLDEVGTRVGSASASLADIGARQEVTFRVPVKEPRASVVTVREIYEQREQP